MENNILYIKVKNLKGFVNFPFLFFFQIQLATGPEGFPLEIAPFITTFSPVLYIYYFHLSCTDKSQGRVTRREKEEEWEENL